MSKTERIHETCSGSLDPRYLRERHDAGWRLVGVEWEREAQTEGPGAAPENSAGPAIGKAGGETRETPFGWRVVPEGSQLQEDSDEMEFLYAVMELIIQDISITKVAEELNRRGFRTRSNSPWGPVAIFNLLPRLVELTPRIFRSEEWVERRKQLKPVF
jgi:hypothetical protein